MENSVSHFEDWISFVDVWYSDVEDWSSFVENRPGNGIDSQNDWNENQMGEKRVKPQNRFAKFKNGEGWE